MAEKDMSTSVEEVPEHAFFNKKDFKGDVEMSHNRLKSDESIIGIKEIAEREDSPAWKPKTHELMIMITMAVSSLVVVSAHDRCRFSG